MFAIHNLRKIAYLITFAVLFVLASIASFMYDSIDEQLRIICLTALSTLYILTLTSLSILFIRKLVHVYKRHTKFSQERDDNFIALVTKITVLNFVSLLITIACAAIYPLHLTGSIYMEFLYLYALSFDYFTNFICVLFSYKHCHKYYMICCGGCHTTCNKCVSRCVEGKTVNEMPKPSLDKVNSDSPGSPDHEETVTSPTTTNSADIQI